MREKELRLALVCYGGISLAVYMHGVTKEIWHLVRASRAELDEAPDEGGVVAVYRRLLREVGDAAGLKVRVLTDIVAGASAGGINGVFLARAVTTGESLDPLTDLWLDKADVTVLLDPDARPWSRFSKFWAVPIAWLISRAPKNSIDSTVERSARAEVRAKLSQFVRARWFAPPFGGEIFSGLLLDAFDAMAEGPKGPALLPSGQPLDLMVTVTDYLGHEQVMRLNSPAEVTENEHRLIFSFRHAPGMADDVADPVGLAVAARATASFPGAFPPFTVREMDRAVAARKGNWPVRAQFLSRQLKGDAEAKAADRVLVDGSVLVNAPFGPAIAALRQRPARREVDRRFVYIDPKPGRRSVSLSGGKNGQSGLPGFFPTIFRTLSDIPREQPIRDNVDALESLTMRIMRMRMIIDAMRPEVEERIEATLGRTFFLDRPTPQRLAAWRAAAHVRASSEGGYSFVAYSHLKLSQIVDDLAGIAASSHGEKGTTSLDRWRTRMWDAVHARGIERLGGKQATDERVVDFYRSHDLGFRIRRLRHLARALDTIEGGNEPPPREAAEGMRRAIYENLGAYFDRESRDHYADLVVADGHNDAAALIDAIAARRQLKLVDTLADERLSDALADLPKAQRRSLVLAYLGFSFYDAATLPLLQGDGDGEFDPIKIDRISPDDATSLRGGGAAATLKGIQFNSFGAFFSRAFRENDYLWGRLQAAERLIAIVASTAPAGMALDDAALAHIRRDAFLAILDEEAARLPTTADLVAELRLVIEDQVRRAAMAPPPQRH
jgi:patatin-related protein